MWGWIGMIWGGLLISDGDCIQLPDEYVQRLEDKGVRYIP